MEEINNIANADVIDAWNECADEKGYTDDWIYENGPEFLDTFFESPSDAVLSVKYGHYKSNDYYVAFDGYGNLQSFEYWEDYGSPIDVNILADWFLENPGKAKKYGIEDDEEE